MAGSGRRARAPLRHLRGACVGVAAAFSLVHRGVWRSAPQARRAFCGSSATQRQLQGQSAGGVPRTLAHAAPQPQVAVCTTRRGQELEELLRWPPRPGLDEVGTYAILSKVYVGPDKELGEPPFIAELAAGTRVEVVEISNAEGAERVRGRITEPEGWISLLNTETGRRWAERAAPLDDFDRMMSASWEVLRKDGNAEQEASLHGDLLHLAAARRLIRDDVPPAPTLEGPPGKTWTFSGPGNDQWRGPAASVAHEVPLTPATAQLRKSIIAAREEYSGILNSYASRQIDGLRSDDVPMDAPFAAFLGQLQKTRSDTLTRIGGACGESIATNLTAPRDVRGSEETTQEWLPVFVSILSTTRIAAADAYFEHALFGLCMRRLIRRFQIERSFGTLPAPSVEALERAMLERSAMAAAGSADEARAQATLAAQLEHFADYIAKPDGGSSALETILALSDATLAAIRRQIDLVFGKGLREELDQKLNEARAVAEADGFTTSMIEATSSLLLEAASAGNLRMFSGSRDAQERLAWDAIAYGAYLQDVEDSSPT